MTKGKKINIIINIIAIIILIVLFILIYINFKDELRLLETKEGRDQLIEMIRSTGIFGSIILILIQALQVIVAFIPGEFVEIISGAMFGPILGLIICLIGLNLGTLVIYGLVKLFGRPFVNENTKNKKFKLEFLNDPKRSLIIIFFIFLLPGIPKDILIYPMPLTKVKMTRFMIVSSIARIPSILSSTFIGASIIEGNYISSIIVFIVFFALAIIGLIFNKQISILIENKILIPINNKKSKKLSHESDNSI